MKRLIGCLVSLFLGVSVSVSFAQTGPKTKPEAARETVAVFVIDNRQYGYGGYGSYSIYQPYDSYTSGYYSDWQNQLVSNFQIELQSAIENTKKWTIVDWQRLGHIQQLQGAMRSGAFDPETVVRSGKLFGVRWAIYVAIEHFSVSSAIGVDRSVIFNQGLEAGFRQITVSLQCSAWMVDVERGIVRHAIRGEKASESTQVGTVRVPLDNNRFFVTKQLGISWLKAQPGRAARLMATRLATKLTSVDLASSQFKTRLLVAKVDGKTVFINQGQLAGIKVGDLFLAPSGPEVRDPDSGQLLGHTNYTIIQVVTVQPNLAVAKIVEGADTIGSGAELNPYKGPINHQPISPPDNSGELIEPTAEKKSIDREVTIVSLASVRVGQKGVIFDDANNNEQYDQGEKVYSEIVLTKVDGSNVTIGILNKNFQPRGGERVWIFD